MTVQRLPGQPEASRKGYHAQLRDAHLSGRSRSSGPVLWTGAVNRHEMGGGARRPTTDLAVGLGVFIAGAGIVRAAIGTLAWRIVRSQLAAERIAVPGSAPRLGGRPVTGPLTAFAEADTVKELSLRATGGRTYGEMGEDDPQARMALDASLIRSSLYTSISAFGQAAGEIANGLAMAGIGIALASLARRTATSTEP